MLAMKSRKTLETGAECRILERVYDGIDPRSGGIPPCREG
jgi:hypothetical protein